MQKENYKIPKWKEKQNEVRKQSFDDAFESLGMRKEFLKAKKKKKTAKKVVQEENVNS